MYNGSDTFVYFWFQITRNIAEKIFRGEIETGIAITVYLYMG